MKFKKKIIFSAAYDKRNPDPDKNYGIHGVDCSFYLTGEKGIVQFKFSTHWFLPHVQKELDFKFLAKFHRVDRFDLKWGYQPFAVDIGYHSPKPMYEGQQSLECKFFKDGCYYDGSGMNAQEYLDILKSEGSKGVWKKMKEYYHGMFDTPENEKTVESVGFGQILSILCRPDDDKKEGI